MHWIFRHFYAIVAIANNTTFHNMKNDYSHIHVNNRFFSFRDDIENSMQLMYSKETVD